MSDLSTGVNRYIILILNLLWSNGISLILTESGILNFINTRLSSDLFFPVNVYPIRQFSSFSLCSWNYNAFQKASINPERSILASLFSNHKCTCIYCIIWCLHDYFSNCKHWIMMCVPKFCCFQLLNAHTCTVMARTCLTYCVSGLCLNKSSHNLNFNVDYHVSGWSVVYFSITFSFLL